MSSDKNISIILYLFSKTAKYSPSPCAKIYGTFNKLNNSNNKYVCIYAYYEKNEEYKNNLIYFLNNGGIINEIDYYIVVNGDSTIQIPELPNVIIVRKENKGYDFGAWQHVIKKYIYKSYDYYIFINSSVIGPYVSENESWLNKFIELFYSGENVKMVGTSICMFDNKELFGQNLEEIYKKEPPYSHIQSMFFILNKEGFNYLLDIGFFDDEEELNNITNIYDIIIKKEIMIGHLLLKNNWNINCILPKYRDLNYIELKHNINPSSNDPYYCNGYFGNTIQPEEVIFYKSYRVKNC